jgi:RNA polymerase sigma factor (sigma-70 family)
MAAHLDPQAQPLGDASDMELVEYTRGGNSAAFGELWVRHSNAGRAVARSHRFDADDLLSEAFARVFQAISAGGGPTAAFRPYLFTTIRNVSMQWARAKSADASEDLDLIADPSTEEDASLAALDKSLTVNAFRSLPTRWQEALWYSEVEQLSSAEIAPLLGMKANAVSALAYRAREGLRQAWIQAHLQRTTDPECAATIERLGSFTRGMLGTRESKRVRDHLAGCTSCTIVADEARQVGSRLALVLLPLAAGVSGAAGFLSWLQAGGGAAGATVAASGMPVHVATSATQTSAPVHLVGSSSTTSATSTSAASASTGAAATGGGATGGGATAVGATAVGASTVGATAVSAGGFGVAGILGTAVGALALGAAVVAAVTFGPSIFSTPPERATTTSEVTTDHGAAADEAGDPAVVVAPSPTQSSAPAPTPAPTDAPAPSPQPRRPNAPTADPKPSAAPAPVATGLPTPAPAEQPAAPPTVQPTAAPGDPSEPSDPSEPPVQPPAAPAAPSVIVEQAADQLTFPLFSGTAEPLSTVQILDAEGVPLASTTAADDGTWSISDFGDSITDGSIDRQVVVQQVIDGVSSEPSAPQQLVVLAAPSIQNPIDGASIPAGSAYQLSIDGAPGASTQRIVNGELRSDIQVLDASGTWSHDYAETKTGPMVVGIRYLDPESGRYGLTRFVSYTIV